VQQSGASDQPRHLRGGEGLTRAPTFEWAKRGVRVTAVAPGHVRTPMLDDSMVIGSSHVGDRRRSNQPLLARPGRHALPEEIAAVLLYPSPPAASYVTGERICVDGATTVNADAR
jgi:NAD(P)-dependent dehydrogenase (short-subunit alcohol dehydrogenase family)